jgi:lipopolysaccharide biosynthesis protein
MKSIRTIAIHLPQFHPIPENDVWWGKGFTEWTNVAKAKPLFRGHYQPHLPADLGFYDLRLAESRQAQADLAREYGIYGFCYYHYWFSGKQLLEKPVESIRETGKPDFPYMLCWANQNWTRRWDGSEKTILISQNYTPEDDLAHIRHLCRHFLDPRYIRVNGKPFFIIYLPDRFPDIRRTIAVWKNEARKYGIDDLYLGYMHFPGVDTGTCKFGFDAAVEFSVLGNRAPIRIDNPIRYRMEKEISRLKYGLHNRVKTRLFIKDKTRIYANIIKEYFIQEELPCKMYPSLFPGWDNTARVGARAQIVLDNTPELYEYWLDNIIKRFDPFSKDENFIFINAWNEWAEGNHLEPCQKWGRAFLEATKRALECTG